MPVHICCCQTWTSGWRFSHTAVDRSLLFLEGLRQQHIFNHAMSEHMWLVHRCCCRRPFIFSRYRSVGPAHGRVPALDLCREISASVVLALRGTIKSRTSFLLMKPFYEQPFLRRLSCGLAQGQHNVFFYNRYLARCHL